jgi:hypothetical protein
MEDLMIQQATTDVAPTGIFQVAVGFMAAKQLFVASEIDLFATSPAGLQRLTR